MGRQSMQLKHPRHTGGYHGDAASGQAGGSAASSVEETFDTRLGEAEDATLKDGALTGE